MTLFGFPAWVRIAFAGFVPDPSTTLLTTLRGSDRP
jgi:hypothetical protein